MVFSYDCVLMVFPCCDCSFGRHGRAQRGSQKAVRSRPNGGSHSPDRFFMVSVPFLWFFPMPKAGEQICYPICPECALKRLWFFNGFLFRGPIVFLYFFVCFEVTRTLSEVQETKTWENHVMVFLCSKIYIYIYIYIYKHIVTFTPFGMLLAAHWPSFGVPVAAFGVHFGFSLAVMGNLGCLGPSSRFSKN